jgi:predicted O-methyltransferase YrrM
MHPTLCGAAASLCCARPRTRRALRAAAPPPPPAARAQRRRASSGRNAPHAAVGSGGGEDDSDEAARRRAALEDELRDPGSPLEYLFPRAVRRTALGALAGGALLSLGLGLSRAAASPALAAADGATLPGLAVNAAVLAAAAAAFAREGDSEGERLQRRAAARAAQERNDDREDAALPDGASYSRLKQVDDAWIVKRLERMAAADNLPSIGPAKGDALAALVREARPRRVLEVGTFLGYSAIRMAQALPDDDARVVSVERELRFVLSARRFLWQCNQGERAPGEARIGRRVRVEWGEAAAVAARLAEAQARSFDFLFIDGTPSETLAHLRACEPLLAPGATVVAHNTRVFEASLAPYVAYVRGETARYSASRPLETRFGARGEAPDTMEVSTWRG